MRQKISNIKRLFIAVTVIEAALIVAMAYFLHQNIWAEGVILAIQIILLIFAMDQFEAASEEQSIGVKNILGSAAKDAYLSSGVGMIIYDDEYIVTWMSELFQERNINRVGYKLLTWIPEAQDIISGSLDTTMVQLDDRLYEIHRKEDAPIIFFRDVTELNDYKVHYENEQTVLGLASFDNYDESTQYLDDTDAANINAAVRLPLAEYCEMHNILLKRLNNSRYLMVLNEQVFNELMQDHFSILGKVRKAAANVDVTITLSMAFARGSTDFEELDSMTSNLLDLAQTRGGDQVAVQKKGEDVHYFGGSTEAAEKRSRVRVRVMSYALRDLINKSSNVIICGHKTADFDCIGSAICISRMVTALHKPVSIIARSGGIEEKLNAVLEKNAQELDKEVNFVSESEAQNQLNDHTLVIMTDHHNIKQSNGARVLEAAQHIVVIDHHRRSTDMGVKPVLIYIEAGASSACELLTEMIPYVSPNTDLSELDANIMLTGVIVDTQQMRVRTGSRTYDAASALREHGADPQVAYSYLKDTFDEFAIKASVATNSERYDNGVVIASVKDRILTRSLMSQVADSLLGVQGVEAAFVIANDSSSETAISARSAGRINVQMIMEEMHGGGHMTAAAMQRPKCSIDDLKQELLDTIDTYFKEEGTEDESDSEK